MLGSTKKSLRRRQIQHVLKSEQSDDLKRLAHQSGFRSLTYDVNAGSMVTTKTVSEGSESQNTGFTVAPHNRSETHAFTWVLECNMLDSEIAYGNRNHPKTGKPIVKVLRPRKGAKVNGGSDAKPVVGHIKAL